MATALILFAGTMALSLWSSFRVKRVFCLYAEEEPSLSGMTGVEAARRIIDEEGVTGVDVASQPGDLTCMAAFITSLAYFLWHLLPLFTRIPGFRS